MKHNDMLHVKMNMENINRKAEVGKIGENIASKYLESRGFTTITLNYRKKWGEIDIISSKNHSLHFIEVKTVTRENIDTISGEIDTYRPEDNIHPWKMQRITRTIQSYLAEKGTDIEGKWQFDIVTVYLDQKSKKARVFLIENVIL